MLLYPVNLNVKDKRCLVVGGGNVAYRKVVTLLEFGAEVVLVSPELCEKLEALAVQSAIHIHKREYKSEDAGGAFLIFAATNNLNLQQQIAEDATKYNVLLNSATDPQRCDFQVPAHFRRGELQVAISTSGASPAVSRMIRERLEKSFGDEYEYAICLLRLIRQRIVGPDSKSSVNRELLEGVLQDDIISCIGQQDWHRLKLVLEKNLSGVLSVDELLEEFHAVCMA